MKKYGLFRPDYEEIGENFVVTFRRKIAGEKVSYEQVGEQVGEQVIKILEFCIVPRSKHEILRYINFAPVYMNYKWHILPLVEKNLLSLTIPAKPQSSKQKYWLTEKGKLFLKGQKRLD